MNNSGIPTSPQKVSGACKQWHPLSEDTKDCEGDTRRKMQLKELPNRCLLHILAVVAFGVSANTAQSAHLLHHLFTLSH